MNAKIHDTLKAQELGTPKLFIASAFVIPLGIGIQFLLAGNALFAQSSWAPHSMFGLVLGLPIITQFLYSAIVPHLRGFVWWSGTILSLYLLQIGLASGGTAALVYHPFNAALLLTASITMVFKVERRRTINFKNTEV